MKVYSWKILLGTVLLGVLGVVCIVFELDHWDWRRIVWLVLFGALVVQGLRASLTEEGYRRDMEDRRRGKRIYRNLFGRFAPVMPWGALILLGIAAVFGRLFPDRPWVCLCFVIAALVYQVWLGAKLQRGIEQDRAQREE